MVAELVDQVKVAESVPEAVVRGIRDDSGMFIGMNRFRLELRPGYLCQVVKEPLVRFLGFSGGDDQAERDRFVVEDRERDTVRIELDRLPRAIQFDELREVECLQGPNRDPTQADDVDPLVRQAGSKLGGVEAQFAETLQCIDKLLERGLSLPDFRERRQPGRGVGERAQPGGSRDAGILPERELRDSSERL